MKEGTERIVDLKGLENPEFLADKLETVAEEMQQDGWFFVTSFADDLLETVTLFFEREL